MGGDGCTGGGGIGVCGGDGCTWGEMGVRGGRWVYVGGGGGGIGVRGGDGCTWGEMGVRGGRWVYVGGDGCTWGEMGVLVYVGEMGELGIQEGRWPLHIEWLNGCNASNIGSTPTNNVNVSAETIAMMSVKYIYREKTLFPSGHLEA